MSCELLGRTKAAVGVEKGLFGQWDVSMGSNLRSSCLFFVLLADISLVKRVSSVRWGTFLHLVALVGEEEKGGEASRQGGLEGREILPGRCAERVLTWQEDLGTVIVQGSQFEPRPGSAKILNRRDIHELYMF